MDILRVLRAASGRLLTASLVATAVAGVWAADGSGARVLLLSSGSRASVVVELDGETPAATAIEATDNQSVAVEIGPVRGKVANQLLQAAADSWLVSQVRVRGVTQGTDGTIITIQVVAKTPVSGSVRRAQRRIYIDLEPREVKGAAREAQRVAAAEAPKPAPTTGTGAGATPAAPSKAPAARPVAPPAPERPAATPASMPTPGPRLAAGPAAAPAGAANAAGTSKPATPAGPGPAAQAPRAGGTAPAAPPPVLPMPAPAAGSYAVNNAPLTSTPGTRAPIPAPATAPPPPPAVDAPAPFTNQAPPVAPPAAAASGGPAAPGSLEELQARAQALIKAPDVKGLERLKGDLLARRVTAAATSAPTADLDAMLLKFDGFIAEAQRNQLAADAALFRANQGVQAGSSVSDFRRALQPIRPEIESVANALGGWSGGSLPPANVQGGVASLLPRLRGLKPPMEIAAAHGNLCAALDALAIMWAKAAVEPPPEGAETAIINRARQAMEDFLRIERTLGAAPSAAR